MRRIKNAPRTKCLHNNSTFLPLTLCAGKKIEILIDFLVYSEMYLTNSPLSRNAAVVPVMKSNERCRDEDEIVSIVSQGLMDFHFNVTSEGKARIWAELYIH